METRSLEQLMNQARSGDAQACYELYQEYKNGIHVTENAVTARNWLDRAIDLNHPEALLVRGLSLLGSGSTEDALEYLKAASQENCLQAAYILGQFYLGNIDRMPEEYINTELGLHLLYDAALKGSAEAAVMLGKCFYTGKWVTRNEMLAVYFLEMAEKNGSDSAGLLLDEIHRVVTEFN